MTKGWIKLHKSLLDWEWYDDKNATRLLVHLLLSVNYTKKRWKGIEIEAGSMVTSWENLAIGVGMSVRQVRTAMDKLVSSGEVSRKATNKYQTISLIKWEKLQNNQEVIDSQKGNKTSPQMTGDRQANDKQMTTTKEKKNNKNSKKERSKSEKIFSDEVLECYERCLLLFDEALRPKVPSKELKWKETIERLNRIDKVPFDLIYLITMKAKQDEFWSKNFLSLTKLRSNNKQGVKYIVVFHQMFFKNNNAEHRIKSNISGW